MARAGLNRGKVASAALELIDREGLDAFTMRRLGEHLGVTPMAVYRHVRDREELFDAVVEVIFDEIDVGALPWDLGWRALAEQYCHRMRDTLGNHPHAVTIFAGRPVRSALSIATGTRMIEQFAGEGIAPADSLRALRALREFTIGHALSLAALHLGSAERSRKPGPQERGRTVLADADDATGIGDHFAFGLTAMLDGLAHSPAFAGAAPRYPNTEA
ncbi:MAG: TetR/AcrR family transcriptional regulator C-terminal domain-containing protein [Brachybacterium sp.]|uniref:TetR/AcrR family transcriptional regulator C-terminal domain-containing protein n=1 Tax=Brachybacterium sp. TaxID=1891286 RepID=UPI002648D608|nr:TetR/AcrR family transcriptional regulator C-terminal domain-containing protein [Brachybacterium sp.]MDN5688302.1 TetR/AcrR family transcriptional regulator C-terminal domain-containing protein [Brachybacterium sp.]